MSTVAEVVEIFLNRYSRVDRLCVIGEHELYVSRNCMSVLTVLDVKEYLRGKKRNMMIFVGDISLNKWVELYELDDNMPVYEFYLTIINCNSDSIDLLMKNMSLHDDIIQELASKYPIPQVSFVEMDPQLWQSGSIIRDIKYYFSDRMLEIGRKHTDSLGLGWQLFVRKGGIWRPIDPDIRVFAHEYVISSMTGERVNNILDKMIVVLETPSGSSMYYKMAKHRGLFCTLALFNSVGDDVKRIFIRDISSRLWKLASKKVFEWTIDAYIPSRHNSKKSDKIIDFLNKTYI